MKIPSPSPVPALALAVLALAFGGCESPAERRSAAIEEMRRSVPPMAAHETYFDGRIVAHLDLGSSLTQQPTGRKGAGGKGGHGGGHRGRHRGGGDSMGGSPSDSGGSDSDSGEVRAQYVDSPMPPALLRLQLENTSSAPITVEVRELNSELGNFATRPDTFTLAPGGKGEPGAMQSLLGVDSLALPVTLSLKVEGKVESKVLTLRPTNPPVDATPPAK